MCRWGVVTETIAVVTTDDDSAAPNNPAGRVLRFLREFQATMRQVASDNAMLVLMKMLDEEQESARIYLSTTRLRIQAESVPDLMSAYANDFGYGIFKHYKPQILDATMRLQSPAGQRAQDIFASVNDAG